MDNVRKRTTTGITQEEEEVVARAMIEWNLNKTVPLNNIIDKTIYTCKYRVSGSSHDGYCTDTESDPFEPYYLLSRYDPTSIPPLGPHYSEYETDSSDSEQDDVSIVYTLLLRKLSKVYDGCGNYGASNYCMGSYMKYKAVEIIPFYHRYLDRMEINLDACKYCWNDDCSSGECLTSIPPPNG